MIIDKNTDYRDVVKYLPIIWDNRRITKLRNIIKVCKETDIKYVLQLELEPIFKVKK